MVKIFGPEFSVYICPSFTTMRRKIAKMCTSKNIKRFKDQALFEVKVTNVLVDQCFQIYITAAVIAGPDIKPVPPICEGKSVLLLCSATCTNGSCQYSWTGYGYNTPVIASSLNIVNVNRTYHNKEYTCTVKDMDNVPKTGKSTLEVHCKYMYIITVYLF